MVGFFETSGRRRLALGVLAAVGTLLGAGARADAAVYAVVAIGLAVVVSARWQPGIWRLLPLPLLLVALCGASYLTSGQTAAVSVGLDGSSGPVQNLGQQIGYNLLNVPELWAGALGFWGLGWLDTKMPAIVWAANLVTFGSVIFAGIRRASRRKATALVLAVAAAWIVPTVVLIQSSALVGTEVQPRYLLPLLVVIGQVALFRSRPADPDPSRSALLTIATVLTVTNAIALHYNIRRYVTGTDVFALNLDAGREWWWGFGPSPMLLWLLGAFAFGAALFLVVRSGAERPSLADATVPAGPHADGPVLGGPDRFAGPAVPAREDSVLSRR
jgi:hypothetical protein